MSHIQYRSKTIEFEGTFTMTVSSTQKGCR